MFSKKLLKNLNNINGSKASQHVHIFKKGNIEWLIVCIFYR